MKYAELFRERAVPKEIKKLRAAGMKIGVFACYMPMTRKWVLLKVSHRTHAIPHRPGWTFPDTYTCVAQFALEETTIRAKRDKGLGKGKRPYPVQRMILQKSFKSERQAYTSFLL